jgi:ADP-ribose pyrophosphatase YjhB (NUDIX family)
MSRPWELLETEYLRRTPWRNARVDRLRIGNGDEISYLYFESPTAVFVVPLMRDGTIALIREYRHPVADRPWAVPAGSVDDEMPESAATRELAEEIGGTCTELVPLGWVYAGSAQTNQKSYAFLATGVSLGPTDREATEEIEMLLLDAEEVFARARGGHIKDSQSALALLMAEPHVRERLSRR